MASLNDLCTSECRRKHRHLSRALKGSSHFHVTQVGPHDTCYGDISRFSNLIHETHICTVVWVSIIWRTRSNTKILFSHMQVKRGKPQKQTQEGIIITALNSRKGTVCGMSAGLTAPEERSRDRVWNVIIRQRRFEKGSSRITGKHAWQHTKKRRLCNDSSFVFFFPLNFCSP